MDGRGSAKDKAWRDLSKKDRERFRKALETVISKSENYGEIRMYLAATIGKPVQDMNLADRTTAIDRIAEKIYTDITNRDNSRPLLEEKWKMFGSLTPLIEAVYRENVLFSERDSTGAQLTKEQQEFFKDSKVRDKKGNINTDSSIESNVSQKAKDVTFSGRDVGERDFSDTDNKYSIIDEASPKKVGIAYQVFLAKDGQLYSYLLAFTLCSGHSSHWQLQYRSIIEAFSCLPVNTIVTDTPTIPSHRMNDPSLAL